MFSRALSSVGVLAGNKGAESEKHKMVRMRRDEYLKYWARDAKGIYIGSEPEGSGTDRLRNALVGQKREMSILESRRM